MGVLAASRFKYKKWNKIVYMVILLVTFPLWGIVSLFLPFVCFREGAWAPGIGILILTLSVIDLYSRTLFGAIEVSNDGLNFIYGGIFLRWLKSNKFYSYAEYLFGFMENKNADKREYIKLAIADKKGKILLIFENDIENFDAMTKLIIKNFNINFGTAHL